MTDQRDHRGCRHHDRHRQGDALGDVDLDDLARATELLRQLDAGLIAAR